MKATELMIGDWVMDTRSNTPLRVNPFLAQLEVPEWKPIPLTPEILEKNLKESIPGLNCMYELGGPYCVSLEQEDCWVFGLTKKAARYPMVKIRYVHELQHALRLCGINLNLCI